MAHPLVLEINTRCWLRELAGGSQNLVTLDRVPESIVRDWKDLGFSHIWLMGVWTTGPKTLEIARSQPGFRKLSIDAFGENGPQRLAASPYAIAEYSVAELLGGASGLREFRSLLNRHGLQLILDFVPNHLGVDHPWLEQRSELFVRSPVEKAGTFHLGAHWVAHGKDPFFPPWIDTAQLDYRNEATRRAMTDVLQSVAAQCDGVRCDMAMLLLNDIFAKTWADFPAAGETPSTEFWEDAISEVRQRQPDFLFLAEAYWDTEPRLEKLGFNYCYDKKFLDELVERKFSALQKHVRKVAESFRPARFLANHDEAPIAALLTSEEGRAAAVLLLAQPGLRLLHDGQLAGRKHRAPVQFNSYWPETEDLEMAAFYRDLIRRLSKTLIGQGVPEFCETGIDSCFAVKWSGGNALEHLVVTNLSREKQAFTLPFLAPASSVNTIYSGGSSSWRTREAHFNLLRSRAETRLINSLAPPSEERGAGQVHELDIELVAGGCLVLEWRSVAA